MDYRAALIEFYKKHNPVKLTEVDALLRKYRGREEELLHALRVKYKVQDQQQAEPESEPPPAPPKDEPMPEMKIVKEEPIRHEPPPSRYREAEVTRAGDTKGRTAAERAEYWKKELERREKERGMEREEKRVESNVKQKAERMKVVREAEEDENVVEKKPLNTKRIAIIAAVVIAVSAILFAVLNDNVRHAIGAKFGLAGEDSLHAEKTKKEGLDPAVLNSGDSVAKKTGDFALEDEPEEKAPSVEDAMNEQPSSATKPTSATEPPADKEESEQSGVQRKKYYIGYSAVSSEETAKNTAAELRRKGFDNAGYFYIPDYDPSGKNLYRIYVGPFNTVEAAEEMIVNVRSENPSAYSFYLK